MKLFNYKPPKWLLDNISNKAQLPTHRLKLMDIESPTRIERLNLKQLKDTPFELFIKRDDLTHSSLHLQGNKIRKLEFLFADAVNRQARHVITAGGLQSNHCRAVAGIANKLNMKSHLLLRSEKIFSNEESHEFTNGNILINRMLDANIYLIEKRAQYLASIEFKMRLLEEKIFKKYTEASYLIPIGGSNITGLFGHVELFDEMLQQQSIDSFIDDIVVTTGSGGTMSSLAISNQLTGNRFNLHAFCVCDNRSYFLNHLKEQLNDLFDENQLDSTQMVNLIECSKGQGYAQSTRQELDFLIDVFKQTGILLDPVYTGKSLYTLVNLLNKKMPTLAYQTENDFLSKLKGKRILFVHTGGQLGCFDNGKLNLALKKSQNNIFNFFDHQNIDQIEI